MRYLSKTPENYQTWMKIKVVIWEIHVCGFFSAYRRYLLRKILWASRNQVGRAVLFLGGGFCSKRCCLLWSSTHALFYYCCLVHILRGGWWFFLSFFFFYMYRIHHYVLDLFLFISDLFLWDVWSIQAWGHKVLKKVSVGPCKTYLPFPLLLLIIIMSILGHVGQIFKNETTTTKKKH